MAQLQHLLMLTSHQRLMQAVFGACLKEIETQPEHETS